MDNTVNHSNMDRLDFPTLGGLEVCYFDDIDLPGSYLHLHLLSPLTSREQNSVHPYPLKINNTQFQFYQSEHFHL